ncbi:hypothetical protein L0F63_005019, partial [Massospora cicadina]
ESSSDPSITRDEPVFGSLKRYTVEPPMDLLPLHKRLKLGHPGLNLQSADQVEDQLTPDKIRQGFFEKFLFKNECSPGVELMFEQFMDRSKLKEMGCFLTSAIRRQRELGMLRASGSPKVDKLSLNEEDRGKWLDSITNPERPFSRLSKEVSYGGSKYPLKRRLRVEQLIKALAERKCPMSNAVWAIRLIYLSEQQTKKITHPQLTIEWTSQMMRLLERGMGDLLRGAKGECLDKYASRWSYYSTLSCRLYFQDLLDQKQFLRWLVDGLSNSWAKGALLIPILISLLPEFARSRALCLLLIRALTPGCELASATCPPFPAFCRGILETMLVQMPDVFVGASPRHSRATPDWTRLLGARYNHQEVVYLTLGVWPTPDCVAAAAAAVMRRNRRFTAGPAPSLSTTTGFATPPNPFQSPVTLTTDLGEVAQIVFQNVRPNDWKSVFRVVRGLLRYVAHLVVVIPTSKAVESSLLRFLDEFTCEGEGREQLIDTFSQLVRQGTFGYMRYLRRAVARGYLNPNFTSPKCASRHLEYLHTLPTYAADKDVAHQRGVTLNLNDRVHAEALLAAICARLPALLDASSRNPAQVAPSADPPGPDTWGDELLESLRTASRYVRGEVVASLVAGVTTYIIRDVQIGEDNWRVISKPGTALISVREFALVAELLEVCQEIGALLEAAVWVLVNTEERTLVPLLVHVFRRHQSTLIACGFVEGVLAAMWRKHQEYKATVNHLDKTSTLFHLHLVLNNAPGTTPEIRAELESSLQSLAVAPRSFGGSHEIPEYVAELYDPPSDATALRSRAASLCMRYRSVPGWWGRLFYNATQLIHHRVVATEGPTAKLLQLVRNYSYLFYFLADFSLDTQSVILEWARALLLTPSPSTSWLLVFLALLAARSLCSLPALLALILPPPDHPVTSAHPLLRSSTLLLLRLLLVDGGALPDSLGLCAQDRFALRLTRFTCFDTIESLAAPFQLLYQLAALEDAYPALQDLQELRAKLSRADWITHICQAHSSAVYLRYMKSGCAPLRTSIKAIPRLMESFAVMLGEGNHCPCSTREAFDFGHPDGHAAFQRNLLLKGLRLDRLLCGGGDPSACHGEIEGYIQSLFRDWVDNPNLPLSLLLQAVQAIPVALYPRVLQYAKVVLGGAEPKPFPDFVNSVTSTLRTAPDAANRFQLVLQTLLHSPSADPEWQQAKVAFGAYLFDELVPFGRGARVQEVMLAANCSYCLAVEYSADKSLAPTEVSLAIRGRADEGVRLSDLCACIELRLELLAPVLPLLVGGATPAVRLSWIKTTLELLTCPILVDPAHDRLFEFALDFFAFLFAEIPKDSKTDTFTHLKSFLSELPQRVPHQLFKEGSASDPGRCLYNPWEWDQGLVSKGLAFPLSRFSPRHVAKPACSPLAELSGPPLLEPHDLEPPSSSPCLPRTASTTLSASRMKLAKSAASPLKSFRTTASSPLSSFHAPSKLSKTPSNLSYPNPHAPPPSERLEDPIIKLAAYQASKRVSAVYATAG